MPVRDEHRTLVKAAAKKSVIADMDRSAIAVAFWHHGVDRHNVDATAGSMHLLSGQVHHVRYTTIATSRMTTGRGAFRGRTTAPLALELTLTQERRHHDALISVGIARVDRGGGAGLSRRLRQNLGNDFAEEKSGQRIGPLTA